jgi:hypothetical protein
MSVWCAGEMKKGLPGLTKSVFAVGMVWPPVTDDLTFVASQTAGLTQCPCTCSAGRDASVGCHGDEVGGALCIVHHPAASYFSESCFGNLAQVLAHAVQSSHVRAATAICSIFTIPHPCQSPVSYGQMLCPTSISSAVCDTEFKCIMHSLCLCKACRQFSGRPLSSCQTLSPALQQCLHCWNQLPVSEPVAGCTAWD